MSLKQGKYYSLTCPSAIWKIHEMAGADGAILDHRVEAGEKECSWGYLNFLRLAHSSMRKKWSWHHFWAMVTFLCLSFLKADPETRIWMQVVYLGGDVRHHSKGGGEWEWEGRKANKGLDHEQVTAEGNWGSISLCDLWKTMWNRSKGIKALFHELRCTGWGSFLGLIPPELSASCASWACSYFQEMPSSYSELSSGDCGGQPRKLCQTMTMSTAYILHRNLSNFYTALSHNISLYFLLYPKWKSQFSLSNN